MSERDEGEDEIEGGESPKLMRARTELERLVGREEKLLLWNHTVGERPPAHEIASDEEDTPVRAPRHSLWRTRRRTFLPIRTMLLAVAGVAAGLALVATYRLMQTPYRPLQPPPEPSTGSAVRLEFARRRGSEASPSALTPRSSNVASTPPTLEPLPLPGTSPSPRSVAGERAAGELGPAAQPSMPRRSASNPKPAPPVSSQPTSAESPPHLHDRRPSPQNRDFELLNSELGRP